jgi:hypothetical protein
MPPTENSKSLNLPSVNPIQEDHLSLDAIIGHSAWTLFRADRLPAALSVLPTQEISCRL